MPAKQHDFTATEIKAGIFVLASFVILIGFLIAIRGCQPGGDTAKTFFAVFTDISGLNRGADVRFGGVRVGKVTAIEPDPTDRAKIRVTAVVEGHVPVNQGSLASINALIGVGDSETDKEAVDLGEVLEALKTTLDEGAGVARSAGAVIDENRAGIEEIVTRLAALEKTATELMVQLNGVIEENRTSIHDSFDNLAGLTGELNERVDELITTLQTTLQYLQDVGGNSSDLINDQRPTIEEMLVNLQETTRNLKEFSRILADQPNALVRGKGKQGRENEEAK
jgi:phospholipid/cholesterol/gamma-HCH transport system substrate-binding protein